MPDFKITDRVHHERYGYGDVLDVRGVEVMVVFDHDTDQIAERKMLSSMGVLRLVPIGEEEDAPPEPARVQPPAPAPVEETPPPRPPIEQVFQHQFAKGDEVAMSFEASGSPVGTVAILRSNGGYRVNLYAGGTMCFAEKELKRTRKAEDIPAAAESMQQIVDPEPFESRMLFARDDRVRHLKHGVGTVVRVYPKRNNALHIRFDDDRYWDVPQSDVTKVEEPPAPAPPPAVVEPDPLLARMEAEITRRGRGAMLAVTQAAGVTISMVYHWRRMQRVTSAEVIRAKIQAWADAPWEPEPVDQLFLDMEAAITARGYGAQASLTTSLNIHKTAVKNWRNANQRVPVDQRAGVRAWLDRAPAAVPPYYPPSAGKKENPVTKEPPPDLPKGQITQDTIKRLLREMGLRYSPCWVIENGDLVKKDAWIMEGAA